MSRIEKPRTLIIAGLNGAGKTIFAGEFLPNEADLIAGGLAPFDPDRAAIKTGHLMLKEIYDHVLRHESFAFY